MKFYWILFFCAFALNAQINPKTKWGEVSPQEIEYSVVPFEPEAAAVILFESGETLIDDQFKTRVYRRIKILNEKGIEAANQLLRYYSYKNTEEYYGLKAQTINIENGKTVISRVEKKDFFDTAENEYWSTVKFTFPNVRVGSIIEMEYDRFTRNLSLIDAWRFQHEYPTLQSKYEIENLTTLDYASLMIGEKITQYSKNQPAKYLSKWELKDIPSFKTIGFLYNPEDVAERIAFQLRGYQKRTGIMRDGSMYQEVRQNWTALNREMSDRYSSFLSNSTAKKIIAAIPDGADDFETLRNIYQYFKKNYNWDRVYGIYPNKTNGKVFDDKTGTSTDLNLLLHSVLKNKGFKNDLVLLSTRRKGKLILSYPYLGQFDMLINVVRLENRPPIYIDASDMRFDLGYMPLNNFNYYGLIVDPLNENLIKLQQPVSEYHSMQNYAFRDNKFMFAQTLRGNGYFKTPEKQNSDKILKPIPFKNSLDLLTTELNRQEKAGENGDFDMERINAETHAITGVTFVAIENPLKFVLAQYQLAENNRERALEFDFPFYYKSDVAIEIPSGYKIEIPSGFNAENQSNNKDLIFIQKADIRDGKLLLHSEFYLGNAIMTENYREIKSFFEKSNRDVNQAILLKKD